MQITPDMVNVATRNACRNPQAAAAALNDALPRYGITSRNAVLLTLAQLGHESSLNPICEDGSQYTATNIINLWPTHFTPTQARQYAGNGSAVLSIAYGGRMGNRPGTQDGNTYRGRGYIQTTGRSEYALAARDTGLDLLNNPDLLLQHGPCAVVAAAYLRRNGCIPYLDAGNCDAVTRKINGGWNGRADRQARFDRLRAAFPAAPVQRFVLVDGGGKQVVWNGRDNPYGGVTLGPELLAALDLAYPQPGGAWQYGPLKVWRRQDNTFVLEK